MAQEHEQTVLWKLTPVVLFVPFIVLLLPIVIAILLGCLAYGVSLTVLVWVAWCTRGVDTLFVYSESPNWQNYIVDSILPRLHGRVVVLNWSERRLWRWYSLPVAVFKFFGGEREYNPMAVVFRPFRIPRTFRFRQSFRDFKHGDDTSLREIEHRLYSHLNITQPRPDG